MFCNFRSTLNGVCDLLGLEEGIESVAAIKEQYERKLEANKRLGTKGVCEGYCNYHLGSIDMDREIGTDTVQ